MRSIVSLSILALLLTACGAGPSAKVCPILPDPSPAAIDALEAAGRQDPSTAAWVVALDRFYQKQDAKP